ncbi:MAG: type II toxin-antitoxin system VapC family toxin [Prevotellaceae bacterium]|jgi:predicted nucleic acid-binding protein|nr:type II toxin-antitoxin system VapC family toxin [Prevotellaceae bacterium]
MGQKYLIDTNVAIDYLANKLPSAAMSFMSDVVDTTPNVSVISQIEILRYNAPLYAYNVLSAFVDCAVIYPLNEEVVQATIALCRRCRIKLPDAVIAATAICHNLTLLTRNTSDFKYIVELHVQNPWDLI